MKAFLLYPGQDVDLAQEFPPHTEDLTRDLELETLWTAMAGGDTFLFSVARAVMLSPVDDPEIILRRQRILRDCLDNPDMVRAMYGLAVEAIEGERQIWRGLFNYPDSILHRSVEVLEIFVGILRRLRALTDEHVETVRSDGLTDVFTLLAKELDDEYFETISDHLRRLKFPHGVLISAQLGEGNRGTDYVLRSPRPKPTWRARLSGQRPPTFTFAISDRDEAGFRALSELRDRGIDQVANALAQSCDHILNFFRMLRTELGFYVGCLNLHERLAAKGEPSCLPVPEAPGTAALTARGMYDVCLSLSLPDRVIGNDVDADGKSLIMITGANEGGKSTFLRSVGLAQLMMRCGMFVPAESLRASVAVQVFSHYKREEDASLRSGKFDEELARMSDIADELTPNSLILFNESFAATNEREGSEIARQIIQALTDRGVTVVFVTHLFDLAHSLYARKLDTALFLRAQRRPDGRRTFRLAPGEPTPTSHGEDLYRQVFGGQAESDPEAESDVTVS
ncbi:MAG TPA: hypothetical protein VF444_01730 [Pseudonocardiaceae bacterium]